MQNGTIDTEFIILENIYDSEEKKTILRQRDLAIKAGTSLGMTNSILRRLAQKGLITIQKLNCRNIRYAITLDGINEILTRSYRYFKRTIQNTVQYKEILETKIKKARQNNISAVILIGVSDLDFIIEHLCQSYDISFLKTVEPDTVKTRTENTFKIYAETINYIDCRFENETPPGYNSSNGGLINNPSLIYKPIEDFIDDSDLIDESTVNDDSANILYLSELVMKQRIDHQSY